MHAHFMISHIMADNNKEFNFKFNTYYNIMSYYNIYKLKNLNALWKLHVMVCVLIIP